MKKLLLSLFVGFVGIISFCSALDIPNPVNKVSYYKLTGDGNYSLDFNTPSISDYYYVFTDFNCVGSNCLSFQCGYSSCKFDGFGTNFLNKKSLTLNTLINSKGTCNSTCKLTVFNTSSVEFYLIDKSLDFSSSCPECPTCDDPYTSMECQTEYNLIPVEDVDINYCVGNGLCPNECGSGTDFSGDLQYSNIYINSILHPGEENIFIDIPDYIQWDYSVDTGNFNLYVGSGYDMDYMNSIIKINSYRPTSSDFTNIFVSGLTLIFPYIFVFLLIVFIWKLIKRVFK